MLNNFQLDDIFKFNGKFNKSYGGCWSKDELADLGTPEKKIYIVNMEDSKDGNGTHWVLCSNLKPNKTLYFDPFGVDPPKEIERFLKLAKKESSRGLRRERKDLVVNNWDIQDLNSDLCGLYCAYVGKKLIKGNGFDGIMSNFDKFHPWMNDKILKRLAKSEHINVI